MPADLTLPGPPSAARAPAAGARLRRMAATVEPWLYLLPVLATLAVWTYLPLAETFGLSFQQWNMLPTAPRRDVGLENYARLLALPEMRQAAWNTLLYIVGLLPLSVLLPLAVALLTQRMQGRLRNLYRALIFLPMIVAPVVAGVVWRWLMNEDFGLINRLLEGLGLGRVAFLQDPGLALWSLVWITGWKLVGFSTLLITAANAGISPAYVEAARMDGAGEWQIVRDIRLPLLSPTLVLLTLMTVIFGAQWSFVYINALTDGGPLGSTTNVFHLMWRYGFRTMSAGWSAAAGMMVFAVFGAIALVLHLLMRRLAIHEE